MNSCFTYLDDILICSTSWEEHLQHLKIIFNCLKSEKLKNKLSKCQFLKQHLYYIGHFISKQGIQPLPEKLRAITHLKEPNSVDELHNFLGLTSYYRRFVQLFTGITKPLKSFLKRALSFSGQHSVSQLSSIFKIIL